VDRLVRRSWAPAPDALIRGAERTMTGPLAMLGRSSSVDELGRRVAALHQERQRAGLGARSDLGDSANPSATDASCRRLLLSALVLAAEQAAASDRAVPAARARQVRHPGRGDARRDAKAGPTLVSSTEPVAARRGARQREGPGSPLSRAGRAGRRRVLPVLGQRAAARDRGTGRVLPSRAARRPAVRRVSVHGRAVLHRSSLQS
jgi:hypothetical protein